MKEAILEELRKYPIVQIACQRIGVGRSTFYKWKGGDKRFAAQADVALGEGKQFTNDMAESQLIKAVGNGHMTGVIYWLKNNHPDYVDRVRYEQRHKIETDDYDERESAMLSQALHNIGLASILKSTGFTYTKEELAEAERAVIVYRVQRKALEQEIKHLEQRKAFLLGMGAGDTAGKRGEEILEKEEDTKPDINGTGPVDMTDIDIRPGMTPSEINRQFMEREIRRNRKK